MLGKLKIQEAIPIISILSNYELPKERTVNPIAIKRACIDNRFFIEKF